MKNIPIAVILVGILTDVSALHPAKAEKPNDSIELVYTIVFV